MLSVSPPTHHSGFGPGDWEERKKAAALALVASPHDVVMGGGWDDPEEEVKEQPRTPSPSHSTSTSSLVEQEDHSPPYSPSPPSHDGIASPLSGSGLLIKSKHQGWERSFDLDHEWPRPIIQGPDEVLIRNVTAGLNPVDFKSILYNFGIPDTPWVLGRDVAGIVEDVGSNVKDLALGQRVWTCADSRDVRAGAYQTYCIARRCHVGSYDTSSVSNEEAATLGTGLVTAAIAAYWFFQWRRPASLGGGKMPRTKKGEVNMAEAADQVEPSGAPAPWVLIYGGGSITGIYMAQLARLAGLRTIAIASPSNFSYLTSDKIGVTECVDRYLSEAELASKIESITQEQGITYVLDCVGSKTATMCEKIARQRGQGRAEMICLAGNPKNSEDTGSDLQAKAREVFVHRISFSTTFYGDETFSTQVMKDLDELLRTGQLRSVQPHLIPDGLAGVRRGLEALRDGTAPRAKKLVVRIAETPSAHLTHLGVRAELGWNGVV